MENFSIDFFLFLLLSFMQGSTLMRNSGVKHVEALLYHSEVHSRKRCSGESQMLLRADLHSSSLPGPACFLNRTGSTCLFSTYHHSAANNCIKSKWADKGCFEESWLPVMRYTTTLCVAIGTKIATCASQMNSLQSQESIFIRPALDALNMLKVTANP